MLNLNIFAFSSINKTEILEKIAFFSKYEIVSNSFEVYMTLFQNKRPPGDHLNAGNVVEGAAG